MLPVVFAIIFIVGIVLWKKEYNDAYDITQLFTVISGFCLLISLISLPISRLEGRCFIEKYKATAKTLELARDKPGNIENAAVINSVIDMNKTIASAKFYNNAFLLDWYIVDEWADLPPLK